MYIKLIPYSITFDPAYSFSEAKINQSYYKQEKNTEPFLSSFQGQSHLYNIIEVLQLCRFPTKFAYALLNIQAYIIKIN